MVVTIVNFATEALGDGACVGLPPHPVLPSPDSSLTRRKLRWSGHAGRPDVFHSGSGGSVVNLPELTAGFLLCAR